MALSLLNLLEVRRCTAMYRLVPTPTAGAIILAKLGIVPVRRGYWGNKIGKVRLRRRRHAIRVPSVRPPLCAALLPPLGPSTCHPS